MKSKILSILLILSSSLSAFARIGETEAQIEKRYGKAQDSFKSEVGTRSRYLFSGFYVFVDFERGISQMETYQKKNPLDSMSATEMAGLCDANASGGWTIPEENAGQFFSYSRNHRPKLVAIYTVATRDMMITTKEFIDRAAANINASTRKKMEGF
jgi:hypothetical protein